MARLLADHERRSAHDVDLERVPHIVKAGAPQYNLCCLFSLASGPRRNAYITYTKVAGKRSGRVRLNHDCSNGAVADNRRNGAPIVTTSISRMRWMGD